MFKLTLWDICLVHMIWVEIIQSVGGQLQSYTLTLNLVSVDEPEFAVAAFRFSEKYIHIISIIYYNIATMIWKCT